MSAFLSDEDIDRIARGLLDRSLPKAEWTHAAHFASALWLLRLRGAGAMTEMPSLIRAYNEQTGVPNTDASGYHETITVASLRAARAWLEGRPGAPLHAVLRELLDSPLGRCNWLLAYWSEAVLLSPLARRTWVEPDRQPLPF